MRREKKKGGIVLFYKIYWWQYMCVKFVTVVCLLNIPFFGVAFKQINKKKMNFSPKSWIFRTAICNHESKSNLSRVSLSCESANQFKDNRPFSPKLHERNTTICWRKQTARAKNISYSANAWTYHNFSLPTSLSIHSFIFSFLLIVICIPILWSIIIT